jgi:hypothetical protein
VPPTTHLEPLAHGAVLSVWEQTKAPLAESQPSSVHRLPSSHTGVHVVVQHDFGAPLFGPSSQGSPGSTTPLPQTPSVAR